MTTEAIARRQWRLNWLRSLRELSDVTTQRATWLNEESGNSHYSFIEFMCSYFDDLALSSGYEGALNAGLVTREEAGAVADFDTALRAYKEPVRSAWKDELVLSDPAWIEVTRKAKLAVERLSAMLSRASEKAALSCIPDSAVRASLPKGGA